jgi:hypothetical protein
MDMRGNRKALSLALQIFECETEGVLIFAFSTDDDLAQNWRQIHELMVRYCDDWDADTELD